MTGTPGSKVSITVVRGPEEKDIVIVRVAKEQELKRSGGGHMAYDLRFEVVKWLLDLLAGKGRPHFGGYHCEGGVPASAPAPAAVSDIDGSKYFLPLPDKVEGLDPAQVQLGHLLFEEPLLSENPEGLAQIAQLVSIPIALGERLYSRWDFKPFLHAGTVDIIQPDLSHAGGLSECRRIAAMAEAYDVAVAPHCPLGPLALGACLQLAATAPNVAIQEMSLGIHYNSGGYDLLNFVVNKEALTAVGGYLPIPEGPGLGVEIDEAAVREADKERHRWRNPIWRTPDGGFAEW